MAQLTINDIARLAAVSKKTVSKVLNHSGQVSAATRDRVRKVIADSGYVPNPQARALALKRNFLIALVHDGTDPFALLEAQEGAEAAIEGSEYALVVRRIPAGDGGAAALATFLGAHRPSGVLLMPPLAEVPAIRAACAGSSARALALGAHEPAEDAISVDERAGVAEAVSRLVALGHRRIAMITGPDGSAAARMRELGYLDALADHDLDRGPALVAGGDFSMASGREACGLLLQVSPRPTAIVAANDAMAVGALHAALAAGIQVPGQLSIAGVGDSVLAGGNWPPLSSVDIPLGRMAEAAARAIAVPGDALSAAPWTAALVERGSTGPAPG